MDILFPILLDFGSIILFLLASFTLVASALILLKPEWVRTFNTWCNRWFSTLKVTRGMDTRFETTEVILRNRWWVGGAFLMASIFTCRYLVFDFEAERFVALVLNPSGTIAPLLIQMVVEALQVMLILVSLTGIAVCCLILIQPGKLREFSEKLDTIFSTQSLQEAMDSPHNFIDEWVLKNHVLVGWCLIVGAIILFVFSLTLFRGHRF